MDEAWLGDWAGSGKAAAKTALSAGGDQKTLIYELCKATILEKLEVEALIEVLKEADCAKLEDFPSVRTQSSSSLPPAPLTLSGAGRLCPTSSGCFIWSAMPRKGRKRRSSRTLSRSLCSPSG